mgnify:CR=1 FL=1
MNKVELTPNTHKGKLIVFEGTDGAGKTTLINLTYKYFKDKDPNKEVILLKQPTDAARNSRLFQKMMFDENHDDINYRAVQLLTLSDRIQHNHEAIIPALKEGKIIICDRYIYTSIANMKARNYRNENWFYEVAKEIIKPEIAISRIKAREEEKDRYLDESLLHRVTNEFLLLALQEDLKVIDSSTSSDITFEYIKKELDKYV